MAYVYIHKKKTNGEVFYVGFGAPQNDNYKRAHEINDRSQYWKNIYKNYGRTVEIVADGMSKWDAEDIEVKLISFYGRRDLGTGTLVNLCDGGNVTIGYRAPKEVIDKFSNANRGERNRTAKLSRQDVINIRNEFDHNDRFSTTKLAEKYNMHRASVRKIITGKRWNFDLAQPPKPTDKDLKPKIKTARNAPKSPEAIAKRNATMIERGHYKKQGERRKGVPLSEEWKQALRKPKTMTNELKASIEKNLMNPESRAKALETRRVNNKPAHNKGVAMSEEQKAKLRKPKTKSPVLLAYWESLKGKEPAYRNK